MNPVPLRVSHDERGSIRIGLVDRRRQPVTACGDGEPDEEGAGGPRSFEIPTSRSAT